MDLVVAMAAMITYHSTPWFLGLQAVIAFATLLFLFITRNHGHGFLWLLLALATWFGTILRDWWFIKYQRRDADFTVVDVRHAFSRGLSAVIGICRVATLIVFFAWLDLDQVMDAPGSSVFIVTLVVIENIHGIFLVELARAIVVWRHWETDFLAVYMDTDKNSVQERALVQTPSPNILSWATTAPRRYFTTGIKTPMFEPVVTETTAARDSSHIELDDDDDKDGSGML